MFGKRVDLFTVWGFKVGVDPSWLIIAFFIVWSLARSLFPWQYEGLSGATYWLMGTAGAIGLFASVIVHELAHALVARRYGVVTRGITLFIFGGVAEMENEPPTPRAEALIAIVGPISSLLIALLCLVVGVLGRLAAWPIAINGVVGYLALVNGALAVFNLVPAYPLDGGRVLRAALWRWKGNIRWATRVAARVGASFGVLMATFGVINILMGNVVSGIWWVVLGIFLRSVALASYQELLVRRELEGEPVRRFMHADPIAVPPSISVNTLVEEYIYKYHHTLFPVVENERLIGYVSTQQVKAMPHETWSERQVGEVVELRSAENTVSPETDAMQVLARMNRMGTSRLMVADGDRLIGIITLKDMLQFFALKTELEENIV